MSKARHQQKHSSNKSCCKMQRGAELCSMVVQREECETESELVEQHAKRLLQM